MAFLRPGFVWLAMAGEQPLQRVPQPRRRVPSGRKRPGDGCADRPAADLHAAQLWQQSRGAPSWALVSSYTHAAETHHAAGTITVTESSAPRHPAAHEWQIFTSEHHKRS